MYGILLDFTNIGQTGLPPPGEAPGAPPTETVEDIVATSEKAAIEPTPIPSGMGQGVGVIDEAGACNCKCLCEAPAFFTFIPESSTTEAALPSTFETIVTSAASSDVIGTTTEAAAITTEAPAQEGEFFFVSEMLIEPSIGSTILGVDTEILLDTTTLVAEETTTTAEVTVSELPATTTDAPAKQTPPAEGEFFFVSEILSDPVVGTTVLGGVDTEILLDTTTPEAPAATPPAEAVTTTTGASADQTPPAEGDGFFFVSSLISEPVVAIVSAAPQVNPGNFFEVDNGSVPSASTAPPAENNGAPAPPAEPENVQEPPATTSAPEIPVESIINGLPEDFDINTYSLSNSYVLGNLGSR